MSMPGLIFLLIKWSMQDSNNGEKNIHPKELLSIANRLYQLQAVACDLNAEGSLELKLRPILIQQGADQGRVGDDILSLKRQLDWFEKTDNRYYDDLFKSKTNITIRTFFEISSYLCLRVNARQSPVIDIGKILIDLSPWHSFDEIIFYLDFLGIKIDKIPEFMQHHAWPNNPVAEYFSDTPFFSKPLILMRDKIVVSNRRTFLRSMSTLGSVSLKRYDGRKFKEKFGASLEIYVSKILNEAKLIFQTEAITRELYAKNKVKGKVVDFIIEDKNRIFLDCKAIEPNAYINTLADQKLLAEGLAENYIKAIWQGQECCHIFNKYGQPQEKIPFLIIVVHRDHYLSSGARVQEYLGVDIQNEIGLKYGYIPIPLRHIYYVTIHDFERLIQAGISGIANISSILEGAVQDDMLKETSNLLFSMHLDKIKAPNNAELVLSAQSQFEIVHNHVIENAKLWNGEVIHFIAARSALMQKMEKM